MDEATSALDPETEGALNQALKSLSGVKTVILIAHRTATLASCEHNINLETGRQKLNGGH
jgi:ABC-type bacteriocin/lantibiotic exporter with double-glycine peptidase domain